MGHKYRWGARYSVPVKPLIEESLDGASQYGPPSVSYSAPSTQAIAIFTFYRVSLYILELCEGE